MSLPLAVMHNAKLDTEATGWVLQRWERPDSDGRSSFATRSGHNHSCCQGAWFWAHLVNVENRWWTSTALKNRCKDKGHLDVLKAPHFRSSLVQAEQHERLIGISHPLKRPEFMAQMFGVSGPPLWAGLPHLGCTSPRAAKRQGLYSTTAMWQTFLWNNTLGFGKIGFFYWIHEICAFIMQVYCVFAEIKEVLGDAWSSVPEQKLTDVIWLLWQS